MMDTCPVPEVDAPPARRAPRAKLAPRHVKQFVEQVVGEDLHEKRVLSLSNGVVGVIHAAALAVHFIGEGLSAATGTDPKHAIKQVDRLLSNSAISVWMFLCAMGAVRHRTAQGAARGARLDRVSLPIC